MLIRFNVVVKVAITIMKTSFSYEINWMEGDIHPKLTTNTKFGQCHRFQI